MIIQPILATVLVALANFAFWMGEDMSGIPISLRVFFSITSTFAVVMEWIDWWRDKDRY
jgi:predicted transcriptional regulator